MSRKGDDDGFHPHPGDPWHPGWSSEDEAAPGSAPAGEEREVPSPAGEPVARRRSRRERGRKGRKAEPEPVPGMEPPPPAEVVEPTEDEVLPPGWWAAPPAESPPGVRVEAGEEAVEEAEVGEAAGGAAEAAVPLFPWWPSAPAEPPAVASQPPAEPPAEVEPETPGYERGAASAVPLDLGPGGGLPAAVEPERSWEEPEETSAPAPDVPGAVSAADETEAPVGVDAGEAVGVAEELERVAAALLAEIGEEPDVALLPGSVGKVEGEDLEGTEVAFAGEEASREEVAEEGPAGDQIAAEEIAEVEAVEGPAEPPWSVPRGPGALVPFPEVEGHGEWPAGERLPVSEGREALEGESFVEGEPLERQGLLERQEGEPLLSLEEPSLWAEGEPPAGVGEALGGEEPTMVGDETLLPPAEDLGLEAPGLVLASWEVPEDEGRAGEAGARGETGGLGTEAAGAEEAASVAEVEIDEWLAFVEGVPAGGPPPGRFPPIPAVVPAPEAEALPAPGEEAVPADEARPASPRERRRGWFRRGRKPVEEEEEEEEEVAALVEAAAGPAREPAEEGPGPQPPPWAPDMTGTALEVEATQAGEAAEEGTLLSAEEEEVGAEAAWAAWEAGDEGARPGTEEAGRLLPEEPAPARSWPAAPQPPAGRAPAGYQEPAAEDAEPWQSAEWAGEPAAAAAAWYAEVDEDEVDVPAASLPEDDWESADEGWAPAAEAVPGSGAARPQGPGGARAGAPILGVDGGGAGGPAAGWAAAEDLEEALEETEEDWGAESVAAELDEAEEGVGVPSAEELEAEGWERFPEPGEQPALHPEGPFPAAGPAVVERVESPSLEAAGWETFPEPGVRAPRWPEEPVAAGPARLPGPEPVFPEDRGGEAPGAEAEPWLPDEEDEEDGEEEPYPQRPAAAAFPGAARASRVDEPTMEIPPPDVYDFEGPKPRHGGFGEGALGGAPTMEHRGLAEEMAAADTAETELQALSAPMAGLESGVVGFEDVAHLGGEEGVGLPARSDLAMRVATGMVLAALLLGSLWVGGEFLAGFVGLMAFLGLTEFFGALRRHGYQPLALFGLPAGIGILVGTWFYGLVAIPVATVAATILAFFYYAFAPQRRDALTNGGLTILGALWVTGTAAFAFPIAASTDFRLLILAVAATVIATDVGAFFAGRAWGSRPMAPVLSPHKTWEGLAGGVVLGIGAAVAMGHFFDEIGIRAGVILGLVVAVMAPLGDLAESMVKRSLGVKDMGSILPGHGGILDRVDAFLFVLPAAWVLFETMGLLR